MQRPPGDVARTLAGRLEERRMARAGNVVALHCEAKTGRAVSQRLPVDLANAERPSGDRPGPPRAPDKAPSGVRACVAWGGSHGGVGEGIGCLESEIRRLRARATEAARVLGRE